MVDMFANVENVRIFAEVFFRPKYGFLAGKARGEGLSSIAPLFLSACYPTCADLNDPNATNRMQKLCFPLWRFDTLRAFLNIWGRAVQSN